MSRQPVFAVYCSWDGKTWVKGFHERSLAKELYSYAVDAWRNDPPTFQESGSTYQRRPHVKVRRIGSERAVYAFPGGVYKKFVFGSTTEWRKR